MYNRCAQRHFKLSELAVQNGGLCSVTTGIGKRLPQIPQLRGSKGASSPTRFCSTTIQTIGVAVQNGGLCSVTTGIGKRLPQRATIQRLSPATAGRTAVRFILLAQGCPKWGSPQLREWKVLPRLRVPRLRERKAGNREMQSGCPECPKCGRPRVREWKARKVESWESGNAERMSRMSKMGKPASAGVESWEPGRQKHSA